MRPDLGHSLEVKVAGQDRVGRPKEGGTGGHMWGIYIADTGRWI